MSFETSTRKAGRAGRDLGMVNYALLFASIFFAGVPALIAVIIAYSQRDEAPPLLASHYGFQIRIFWVAFALSLAAGACVLAVLVEGVGGLFGLLRPGAWDGFGTLTVDLSRLTIDRMMVAQMIGAAVLAFLTTAWLALAPAFGCIRLASDRGIGHSPAP